MIIKKRTDLSRTFWPKILTLLSIGTFIYWAMASQNANKIWAISFKEVFLGISKTISFFKLFDFKERKDIEPKRKNNKTIINAIYKLKNLII